MAMDGIGSRFGIGNWPGKPANGEEDVMSKLAQHMLKEQDADKSGDLVLDETKLDQNGFNNIDRNGDGVITRDEILEGLHEKKGDIVTILQERAEEMQTYGPPKGAPRAMAAHLMNQFDADKSQDLTLEETGQTEENFNAMDADGDGLLTADEIATAVRERLDEARTFLEEVTRPEHEDAKEKAKEVVGNLTNGLMDELDQDNNGEISQDESTLSDELFARLDTNGDGVLSSEEIAAALRDQPELAREFLTTVYGEGNVPGLPENWIDRLASGLMKAFDKDDSGGIDFEESRIEEETFSAVDADGDGVLSSEELAAAISDRSQATRELVDEIREEQPHRDPRFRRAMASYRGGMGDLMADVFNDDEGTDT